MKNLIGNILHGREGHISPWVGEIVYVKDVALSILRALVSNSIKFRIYNVGMGEIYSPEQIINIFSKISPDSKIRVESGGDMVKFKPAILAERPMDLKRSRNELGYNPEYLMEEAILDYMKWYKSHI
jgi:UDP-glucose 4-epimerase